MVSRQTIMNSENEQCKEHNGFLGKWDGSAYNG